MFDKSQSTHTLGLKLDQTFLRGVALSSVRGKPKLDKFFEVPIEIHEENQVTLVKPLYTERQKEQLQHLSQRYLTVTALQMQDVLIRPLELKIRKEKDIDAVLAFQAETLLPYPVENAVLDKVIHSQDKEGSRLTVFAVRKDHLSEHLREWHSLDIEPELITTEPIALTSFAKYFVRTEQPFFVLHLGVGQFFCIVVDQGQLIATQGISEGIGKITEGSPAQNEAFEALRLAVTRTLYSLAKQVRGREIHEILFTGPGVELPGFVDAIIRSLNKKEIVLEENAMPGMSQKQLQRFALPMGEALNALPIEKDQINFRQEEFAYPYPWRRLKPLMLTYMVLCVGLAVALYIFGQAYLSYQEAEIKKQYLELLNVMNKPHSQFETEFANKMPQENEAEGQRREIQELTPQDIDKRLLVLEKEIQATPQIYPLMPNVPLVSDVLAWLSNHPNFVVTQVDEESPSAGLQIESFNYALVKRPEPSKKQEKYQVKVELEFSSPTPKMARAFHDALITPNELVDPKGEIKWNSNRDKYRTSFFLKDKTIYSSP